MGREEEFTEYVAARWPRLVRSAVLLGCSDAEAEDVVQTALERCLANWTKVRRADDRDAYVHRVVVNTFVSSRRRRWFGERPTATLPDRVGPDETARVDEVDAVLRALRALPFEQRVTVVLRYYANMTERQVAVTLGIASGTVKSRLSRALTSLATNPHLGELRELR